MKFKITVCSDDTTDIGREFVGEFEADTRGKALKEAREFYAYELDTVEDSIRVLACEEIGSQNQY